MKGEFDRGRLLPINVIRTGFKEHQYHVIRNEGYAAYQISVCVDGEGKFVSRNEERSICRGDVFLFSPRVPHEYYPVSKRWQMYFFVFAGDCTENVFRYFDFSEVEVFSVKNDEENKRILELCRILNETGDDYIRSLRIYELMGILARQRRSSPSAAKLDSNERYKKMAPVLDYIRNNYKEPLTLDELAEMIDVSKSYLCRIFRNAYGVTPIKYLQNYRISRAKQLLISTDIKLKYLCREVGFNDISYFCLIFRQYEGMTPEEFRSLHND
ncbi:MAG: helix-turn-helix transcriptional regulator [Clostridia bacterium]|nr:helix-turn-helix transcriptional regulator [Clostridia bacterium]